MILFPFSAINAAIDALVMVTNISSLEATGAYKLAVTFNQPITDTSAATFTAKRGLTSQTVSSVEWNDDYTVATLTLASKLKEATYTVSVTGLADDTLTATVDTEAETLASISFLSTNLVMTSSTSATVGFEVMNQYGEDVTDDSIANNIDGVIAGATVASINDGVLTVTTATTDEAGDTFNTTLFDDASGVTANATLTLVDSASAAEITIGELYNENDAALNLDSAADGEQFYLLVDLVDQYGNAITDAAVANADLLVISSDTSVLELPAVGSEIVSITIDEVDYLAVQLVWPASPIADDTTIRLISTGSGTVASETLTVAAGFKIRCQA
jgi:hypothetical protein